MADYDEPISDQEKVCFYDFLQPNWQILWFREDIYVMINTLE